MSSEFRYEFVLNDLAQHAIGLAARPGFSLHKNSLIYPSAVADGCSKFYKINDYISFQLVNYTARQKMIFSRKPSLQNHVAITFQNFTCSQCREHDFECNEIIITNNEIGSVQCKSTKIEENVIINAGLTVKQILVLLKEGWLDNILMDSVNADKFTKYLVRQEANLRKEYLGHEQRDVFAEIFDQRTYIHLENLYYESRILNLLQSFLSDVLMKDDADEALIFSNEEDIRMMQGVEKYITESLLNPFPGLDQLSRMCCMSRTKFVNLFSRVYGMGSFEYYQKKRLNIAYDFLKTGKYSIGDIANFTL